MSYGAPGTPEFDFWEFVCCSRCRMPFGLENGSATVPFWLTECGHIICNNHLSSDRSCCQCGVQDIQLAPLQREMDPPMSEWFQSIPLSLESVAYAAKFQQEAMASQIRYHKLRHQQLRQLVERLRQEIEELKRARDSQTEHQQQQMNGGARMHDGEVSHHLNVNGKREMAYTHQFDQGHRRPRTDSSPRSITTPVGPDRLTLFPGQQPPELSAYKQQGQAGHPQQLPAQSQGRPEYDNHHGALAGRSASSRNLELSGSRRPRPTSSRPLEQYAYTPRDNDKFHAIALNHNQAAPRIFQRSNARQDQQIQQSGSSSNEPVNPPSSSRFKPARFVHPTQTANASRAPAAREVMGPPPTPQHVRDKQYDKAPVTDVATLISGGAASRRFFPEPSDNQTPHGTRGISRASGALSSGNTSGQRTPFVSNLGQRSGFG